MGYKRSVWSGSQRRRDGSLAIKGPRKTREFEEDTRWNDGIHFYVLFLSCSSSWP